jgi:3-deoxy-D-manno-octulosonate 8-phosphate phosphatase (KDO 8-P phosphatase)
MVSIATIYKRFRNRKYCQTLRNLRLLVLDVDGVFTDGGLWYSASGEDLKRFDVKDGMGIGLLRDAGIEVCFLSGGSNQIIESRATYLGVQYCVTNVKDKAKSLSTLQQSLGILANQTGYVGDDINDIPVIPHVAIFIAPADAVRPVRRIASMVLINSGGHGAVREIADEILRCRGMSTESSGKEIKQ